MKLFRWTTSGEILATAATSAFQTVASSALDAIVSDNFALATCSAKSSVLSNIVSIAFLRPRSGFSELGHQQAYVSALLDAKPVFEGPRPGNF
jgi:hypothetical protein